MATKCMCPGMPLIGLDGYCKRCRPVVRDTHVVDPHVERVQDHRLPSWVRAVRYVSDDDLIVVTVAIPTSAGMVDVNFETVVDDAEALGTAILACVARARTARTVLDANATETTS